MALEAAFGESYPVIAPFALEWMEEGRVKGPARFDSNDAPAACRRPRSG